MHQVPRYRRQHRRPWNSRRFLALECCEQRNLLAADSPWFLVADSADRSLYAYTETGLTSTDVWNSPLPGWLRGVTSHLETGQVWTVDIQEMVQRFSAQGEIEGTWFASGPIAARGLATDGNDIWLVDAVSDRVYRYAEGTQNRRGTVVATDSFSLHANNRHASGIAFGGGHLFVTDTLADRIFVYSQRGNFQGSWRLDSRNQRPNDVALANQGRDLWVTDFTDSVIYVYSDGAMRRDGGPLDDKQPATRIIPLDTSNTHPDGVVVLREEEHDSSLVGRLQEGTSFAPQFSVDVELGRETGTRTIQFDVAAVFDPINVGGLGEDRLLVSLVDTTGRELLPTGNARRALFEFSARTVEMVGGIVQFDGRTVQIDVSSLTEQTRGRLQFQLVSTDVASGTSILIRNLVNEIDPFGIPNVPFQANSYVEVAGPAVDTKLYQATQSVLVTQEQVRLDAATGTYEAILRLENKGSLLGRNTFVVFDRFPQGVSLVGMSGQLPDGRPYLNVSQAIDPAGLAAGVRSRGVRLEIRNPNQVRVPLSVETWAGPKNHPPTIEALPEINMFAGDVRKTQLVAHDPDGDSIRWSLQSAGDLLNGSLQSDGQLTLLPTPEQIGEYHWTVIASDGDETATVPLRIQIHADPITTTRISGQLLNTRHEPLAGVPIEFGMDQTVTQGDGTFRLELTAPLDPDGALYIRGSEAVGIASYPFIAEKLDLLLGHAPFERINNVIERPIYLPALDVDHSTVIDPLRDTVVRTPLLPGAEVFVGAGTLNDPLGELFTGSMNITAVPVDLTPAALPEDQFADLVVTIQPGEMQFTRPAPLTLPNVSQLPAGTKLNLWSINPVTGRFDQVGRGEVRADRSVIETIEGGIRNSSWHFFSAGGPTVGSPGSNPRNQNKDCDDRCEERDRPNDDPDVSNEDRPPQNDMESESDNHSDMNSEGPATGDRSGGNDHAGPTKDQERDPIDPFGPTDLDLGPPPVVHSDTPPSATSSTNRSPTRTTTFKSDVFDPKPASQGTEPWNKARVVSPSQLGTVQAANITTEVALHSGVVYKQHALVPYTSLGKTRSLVLSYDSERADPRPIVHTSFANVANSLPDVQLISKLAIRQGPFEVELPGYAGPKTSLLQGGEHFFDVPDGATRIDAAIQADLRSFPSGRYTYVGNHRFGMVSGTGGGTAASSVEGKLVHVNGIRSPWGAGWGMAGLLELVENDDGSVLLIDGEGGESVYEVSTVAGSPYDSPPGDFSILRKKGDGTFERTDKYRTVEQYSATGKLLSVTDRLGNQTRYLYDTSDRLLEMIDPVGLKTHLRYVDSHLQEIEDPAGRITRFVYQNGDLVSIVDPDGSLRQFEYDRHHRLIAEVDQRGHREVIRYDFAGRVTELQRRDGTKVLYAPAQTQGLFPPDKSTNPQSIPVAPVLTDEAIAQRVDPRGHVRQFVLDQPGQLANSSDGAGILPTVARNGENLIEQLTDGRGNVTQIRYDDRGNPVHVSDAISRGGTSGPMFPGVVYSVDIDPVQVITADVDLDGFDDAIVANGGGNGVSVLRGDGHGGFEHRIAYAVPSPRSVAMIDANGDSWLDLITANRGGTASLLLGQTGGSFAPATSMSVGLIPNSIVTGDLNQDGRDDFVISDVGNHRMSTWLGDGAGNFRRAGIYETGNTPASVTVADLDQDGLADVVTANALNSGLTVWWGLGDGTMTTRKDITLPSNVDSVAVGDVTGDNIPDLLATAGSPEFFVLKGRNNREFDPVTRHALTERTGTSSSPPLNSKLVVRDLDGDRDLDVAVAESAHVTVLRNDGRGTWSLADAIPSLAETSSLAASDLNLDGILDLVPLGRTSQSIIGLMGNNEGTYSRTPARTPEIAVGVRPLSLDHGDFNGDGHQDVATVNLTSQTVSILLGNGKGQLQLHGSFAAGANPGFIRTADMDHDGDLDLIVAHGQQDAVSLIRGDGRGSFAPPERFSAGAGPRELVIVDLNRDGHLDVVTAGNRGSTSQYAVLLNNGLGIFTTLPPVASDFTATTLDVADWNGDGNLDLAIGNAATSFTNRIELRLGNGDGTFGSRTLLGFGGTGFAPGPPSQIRLVDVTGDSLIDVVGTDPSTNSVRIRPGLGNGTFGDLATYAVVEGPTSLDVADMDGDGITDLIATGRIDRISMLRGRGDGTFYGRTDFLVGRAPEGIELTDLDEDGRLDFVVVNRDNNSLSVGLNTGLFVSATAIERAYDPTFSQVTRSTDEERRQVLFEIDPLTGNQLSQTIVMGTRGGSDDLTTRMTYSSRGELLTSTDPLGRVTRLEYNNVGQLVQIFSAWGSTEQSSKSFAYDSAGNLSSVTDELGHITRYEYDVMNRRIKMERPDPDGTGPMSSSTMEYRYDPMGNLTEIVDDLGQRTTHVYDEQQRLVRSVNPLGEETIRQYDAAGNLTSITDRLGRQARFDYDERNRLVRSIDPLLGTTHRTYDADNNLILLVDPLGRRFQYAYDARNRQTHSIDPLQGVASIEYDKVNQIAAQEDPLHRRTEFEYDDRGRVIRQTFPDPDGDGPDTSPIIRMSYDRADNRISRIDPLGHETTWTYDMHNRATSEQESDPDGDGPLLPSVTRFQYDLANRLIQSTDALEQVTQYTYDARNRLVTVAHPDPDNQGPLGRPIQHLSYDSLDRIVASTDPLGHVTTYAYDPLSRLNQTTLPDLDGSGPETTPVWHFAWDRGDRQVSQSDPLGRTTRYVYDNLDRLTQEILPDPDQNGPLAAPIFQYDYDVVGNRIATTDPLGQITRFAYDSLNRRIRIERPDPTNSGENRRTITQFRFDSADQLIQTTDPLGRETRFAYDLLGRLIEKTEADPDGATGPQSSPVTRFAYDTASNLIRQVDPMGRITEMEYDEQNRLTLQRRPDPDGEGPQQAPVSTWRYDAVDQIVAESDPLGRITRYRYNNLGQRIEIGFPDPDLDGPQTPLRQTFAYDWKGNVTRSTDPANQSTQWKYDPLYRQVQRIDSDPDATGPSVAPVTQFDYDLAGQLVRVVDPLERATTYVYDDVGRPVMEIGPDPDGPGPLAPPRTETSYSGLNLPTKQIDPLGQVTRWEYDGLNRMTRTVRETTSGSNVVQYEYDLAGNLVSVKDPLDQRTVYGYDHLNRRISDAIELNGLLSTRLSEYDLVGNLTATVDRNGRRVEFQYDALDRQVHELWIDGTGTEFNRLSMIYDESNQLLSMTDAGSESTIAYAYDQLGRVIRQDDQIQNRLTITFDQEFDPQSRLANVRMRVGDREDFRNAYSYDNLGRLVSLHQLADDTAAIREKQFDFTYDTASQLGSIRRSTRATPSSPLVEVTHTSRSYDRLGRLTAQTHGHIGANLHTYTWSYDAGSRLISEQSSIDGRKTYDYDRLDQLVKSASTETSANYSYDAAGNRNEDGYRTDPYNRIAADGKFTYTYDDEGNRTSKTEITSGQSTEYVWDHRNRLVSTFERNRAGELVRSTQQHYDADNRWIGRTVDADGDGAGSEVSTRFVYHQDQIVAKLDAADQVQQRYLWGPAVDLLLAEEERDGDLLFPLADHLGSLRDWVNDQGTIVRHTDYEDFGERKSEPTETDSLFAYTGRPFDAATGLQQHHRRWYDPLSGRWLSDDPLGSESTDSNLQRYVGNHPTYATDPFGLEEISLSELKYTHQMAQLANLAYLDGDDDRLNSLASFKIKQYVSDYTGLRAAVFENSQTNEVVLAFAGTEDLRDFVTDAGQAIGLPSNQYGHAVRLARQLKREYGNRLVVVGHSLGGGLATVSSLATKTRAYIFNAAGVNVNTRNLLGAYKSDEAIKRIHAFSLHGDLITSAQDGLVGIFLPDTIVSNITIPRFEMHEPAFNPWHLTGHKMSLFVKNLGTLIELIEGMHGKCG